MWAILSLVLFTAVSTLTEEVPGNKTLQVGEFPRTCRETKPVSGNYTKEGKTWNLGDMPIYETMDATPKKVIVLAYDIFGNHPNTYQIADKIAREGGFRVVIPDYFRGEAFPGDNFPPKDMTEIYKFVDKKGNWDKNVKADTLKVIEHYKAPDVSFAILGFCWGGMIGAAAGGQLSNEFKAAALVHPGGLSVDVIKNVKTPTYLMPCVGDPDLMDCYKILQKNLGDKCGYHRFTDVHHGFAAARGNYSDPLVQKRVEEVVTNVKEFFNANM